MKTLAIVPARSGSKGIPGKNMRDFCGKPLLAWAVEIGRETCDWTLLHTDSGEYATLGASLGADFVIAGAPLHTDTCAMIDVLKHAVRARACLDFDTVVLLQPTQPLRRKRHVIAALRMLEEAGADSVVSVVEIPEHYHPNWALFINGPDPGYLVPADFEWYVEMDDVPTSRQKNGPAWVRDGTVYVTRRKTIEAGSIYGDRCVPLVVPHGESVNINTEEDWERAEALKEKASGLRQAV